MPVKDAPDFLFVAITRYPQVGVDALPGANGREPRRQEAGIPKDRRTPPPRSPPPPIANYSVIRLKSRSGIARMANMAGRQTGRT